MYKLLRKGLFIFVLLIASSCSRQSGVVIAKIDGTDVTDEYLRQRMMMEGQKYDRSLLVQKGNFEEFRRQVLDKLIQEAILLNEANRLKIEADDDELKKALKLQSGGLDQKEYLEKLASRGISRKAWHRAQQNRLTIEKLIQKEVFDRVPISEENIAAYYRKNIHEFMQPTQFRARQIIVDTRELAEEIVAKLKKGGDFAELAREHSLSPDSKRGGDLGYFDASTYPEVFAEACQKLEIGGTSGVVATDYGYQIFQLLDRREPRQKTLEDVAPSIRHTLAEERGESAFEKWFENLKKRSNISINKDALAEVRLEDEKK